MTLARAIDAVGPVQPGIEPLRAVGRAHLHGEHVAKLVEEGARVLFGGEIAALPAPIGPGAGQPVEHLLCVGFAAEALVLGQRLERPFVRDRPPEPGGDGLFLDLLGCRGTPALRKYFWARMSAATSLQCSGTVKLSKWKTTEPSGLRISLALSRKGMAS